MKERYTGELLVWTFAAIEMRANGKPRTTDVVAVTWFDARNVAATKLGVCQDSVKLLEKRAL